MAEFFERVEKKYALTKKQYEEFLKRIQNKVLPDSHGKSTIYNIYFDTNQYELIRNSIEKPIYKDKVRIRCYEVPNLDSKVFVEIKRKYDGIVSKRRICCTLREFYENRICQESLENKQVADELNYYFSLYNLKEKVFISYDREAFYDKNNPEFRITFDSNILARDYDLRLEKGNYGKRLIPENTHMLEIKTLGAIPLEYVKILSALRIYPSTFSKYGKEYCNLINKNENSQTA